MHEERPASTCCVTGPVAPPVSWQTTCVDKAERNLWKADLCTYMHARLKTELLTFFPGIWVYKKRMTRKKI